MRVTKINTDIWQYLKSANRPILLYGMGNGADKVINELESNGVSISGVFASDGFVRNKTFHGFKITDYLTAKENFPDMIALFVFGSALPEVINNVKRISKETELYVPDVPVYGETVFNSAYFSANEKTFAEIESILADELSKKTYRNVINFKLTGNPNYLYDCEVSPESPFSDFFKLGDNETFVDLGAYSGDTVKEFLSLTNNSYNEIIAVEPDLKSFKRLLKNSENTKNFTAVNSCIGKEAGTCFLSSGRGRGSSKAESGIETPITTLDALLENKNPTYIKFDVEGEELNAILGGAKVIKNKKPKMLISAYHRSEDLITIPKAVLNINKDYKVYVRHYPYLPAWDVNFYFV